MYPNTQGSIWMESGIAGKNLEVLMENKLNTSQKRTCVAKKANILGCFSQQAGGGGSFPTFSTAETASGALGSRGRRQIQTYQSKTSESN